MPDDSKRGALRGRLLQLRAGLSDHARRSADAALVTHVRTYLQRHFGPPSQLNVSAYLPIRSEPDLRSFFGEVGQLSLPSVADANGALTFLRYTEGMTLVKQGFNVLVPEAGEVIVPDLLLIPCVGFHRRPDGRFDRLGYGGGYYDRTLSERSVPTIGIAYALSAMVDFQAEDHDRTLDIVITEQGPIV